MIDPDGSRYEHRLRADDAVRPEGARRPAAGAGSSGRSIHEFDCAREVQVVRHEAVKSTLAGVSLTSRRAFLVWAVGEQVTTRSTSSAVWTSRRQPGGAPM
jgi:hypothetical protein